MRIYIDTSVIGGCFDEEFKKWSEQLINEFVTGSKIAVISDTTMLELVRAPATVMSVLDRIPVQKREMVSMNEEAKMLAQEYLNEGVVGPMDMLDAQHIAIATVVRVDVLVSWNFKHIVNWRRIRLYDAVNLKQGYGLIEIRSPREVLDEEEL